MSRNTMIKLKGISQALFLVIALCSISLCTEQRAQSYVKKTTSISSQYSKYNNINEDTSEKALLTHFNINIMKEITFKLNSDQILEKEKEKLHKQVEWLMQHSSFIYIIEGYCDIERGVEYNLSLGDKRAYAIKKYMMLCGLQPYRIQTVTYGKQISETNKQDSFGRKVIVLPYKRHKHIHSIKIANNKVGNNGFEPLTSTMST